MIPFQYLPTVFYIAGWIFVGFTLLIVMTAWSLRKQPTVGIKKRILLLGLVYLTVTRWKAAVLTLIIALIPFGPDAARFGKPSDMDNWLVVSLPPFGLSNSYLYGGNHTWVDFVIQIVVTLLITALIILLTKRFPMVNTKKKLK